MNCQETQDWLLQADGPEAGPPEAVEHLRACPDCQRLASRLQRLEGAYRQAPLPASADQARVAFLSRLAFPRHVSWRRVVRRAVAALVLLAVGLGTWALLRPQRASAADLVERLIDWELELTAAPSTAERQRIFSERADTFQTDLRRARLRAEDRALAQWLFDVSAELAQQRDPLKDAERFDQVADRLLERIKSPHPKARARDKVRVALWYRRVLERGLDPNVELASANAKMEARQKRRLDRLKKRDLARIEAVQKMLQADPEATHPEVLEVLERPRKPGRPRPRNKR